MKNAENKIKALYIIINAGFAETALEIARDQGAGGATIINARGTGAFHKSILGITVDTEREIVLTLVEKETADRIAAKIKEKAGVHSPMNAICFTLPVDKVAGLSAIPEKKEEDA